MMGRWRLFGVLVLAASLLVPVAAGGAEESEAVEVAVGEKPGADSDLRKVSAHLLEARRLARSGASQANVEAASATSRFAGDDPLVELSFDSLTPRVIAQVESLGFRALGVHPQYGRMAGYAPFDTFEELAAIPELAVISPEYGYITNPGVTISQADVSMNVGDARSDFSVDGTGINVGILSDSFNTSLGGTVTGTGCAATVVGMDNQLSGDLPSSVKLLDNGSGGTDEGAAMAELVHDLAPGAEIMYHSALPGTGFTSYFADGIAELVDCGADVIVDDIFYFAEPMFQDGLIAQAATAAVDAGVPYFTSAGNHATYGVMETFDDWGATDDAPLVSPPPSPSGDDLHDFGGGDRFADFTLDNGETVIFVLQWDEPWDGVLGDGAAVDLDLYVYPDANPAAPFTSRSVNDQGGCIPGSRGGNPYEFIRLANTTGSTQTYHLAVDHRCGSEDVEFRIATFGDATSLTQVGFDPGVFNDLQVYGHAAADGVAAVGAIYYAEVDSGGTLEGSPGVLDVEDFSSLGGNVPIVFDASGNPLPGGPVTRFRPQIAAVDGTNTTFFGFDSDGDSFPNFFGTSAAAPHAAAVAALMLDANSGLTPAEILDIMESTATDIEDAGVDNLSGHGLVDAHAAMGAVPPPDTTKPTWPAGSKLTAANITETSATVSWNAATDAISNGEGQPAAVTSYRVYLDGALDGTTASTSYTFSGLVPGETYTARVEAVDGAGNQSTDGPSTTFTTAEEPPPIVVLPPGGTFGDDNGNIHEGNIEAIAAAGITKGCNPPINDQYCPKANVTRAQMAAFLVRALNLTDDGGGNKFVDDDGSVFEADIARLAAAGITKGCNPPTNNRFCPNDPVKRDQMASFLARALNLAPLVPPSVSTIGDGVWVVGSDVTAGTYRNSDSSDACYWARLNGFGGEIDDIIANDFTYEIDIVTIEPGDAGFESIDCGTWSTNLAPRTASPTAAFGGGTYLVGSEVAAGTWRNSNSSDGCYWERLAGFGGNLGDIISNQFVYEIQTVSISSSDAGFSSEGCGTWTKVG